MHFWTATGEAAKRPGAQQRDNECSGLMLCQQQGWNRGGDGGMGKQEVCWEVGGSDIPNLQCKCNG